MEMVGSIWMMRKKWKKDEEGGKDEKEKAEEKVGKDENVKSSERRQGKSSRDKTDLHQRERRGKNKANKVHLIQRQLFPGSLLELNGKEKEIVSVKENCHSIHLNLFNLHRCSKDWVST